MVISVVMPSDFPHMPPVQHGCTVMIHFLVNSIHSFMIAPLTTNKLSSEAANQIKLGDFVSQSFIMCNSGTVTSCNIIRFIMVKRIFLTSCCLIAVIVLSLSAHSRGTMQHLVRLPPTEWQTVRQRSQAG